jgi:hypothetical protein
MTWSPRDTRRWGSAQTVQQAPTIGATNVVTRELVRAEGPAPALWTVMGQVVGVAAADFPPVVAWTVLLELGLGDGTMPVELAFTPGTPWIVSVPAQWLTVRMRYVGAIAVGGAWSFSAIAAPATAWDGIAVEVAR